MIIIVLFWSVLFKPKKLKFFFDKYSVQQSNPTLTEKGVMRLPLYLSKSKTLLCAVDGDWAKRLWCVR